MHSQYWLGGCPPAMHTQTNHLRYSWNPHWESFPPASVFIRKSPFQCSLTCSGTSWTSRAGRQLQAKDRPRVLAQEGTSSPRHQDSQLQGTLQTGSKKQSEKQPKPVGPWTRIVLARGACQLQCKEPWELRLRAQPERTTCSVGTQRKCVLEGEQNQCAFRQRQGGTSVHICIWLKEEGVHGAAARAQSRTNRLKAQMVTLSGESCTWGILKPKRENLAGSVTAEGWTHA